MGPSIKDVGTFLAIFDTPLPHVRILTLIYLASTFWYLATSKFETPFPPKIFWRPLWMAPILKTELILLYTPAHAPLGLMVCAKSILVIGSKTVGLTGKKTVMGFAGIPLWRHPNQTIKQASIFPTNIFNFPVAL